MLWLRHFTIALATSLTILATCRAEIDKSILARLDSEAPGGWAQLAQLHRMTHFVTKETHAVHKNDATVTEVKQITIKRKGDQFLVSLDDMELFGANPRYRFTVHRTQSNGSWLLKHVAEGKEELRLGEREFDFDATRAAWSVFDTPLQSLIKHRSFHLQKLTKRPDGLVEFAFSISPPSKELDRLAGGNAILDPSNHWAVNEYDAQLRDAGESQGLHAVAKVEYGPTIDNALNLKHLSYGLRWLSKGKPKAIDWDIDYQSCEPCKASDRDFTLLAFNLPEPGEGFTQRSGNTAIWTLVLVAVGCFGLAAVLSWSRKRAAA